MRQIKFKAYIKEANTIVEPSSIEWVDGKIDHIHLANGFPLNPDKFILLEYTGLKIGRDEVYLGDIVYFNDIYHEVVLETGKAYELHKIGDKYPNANKVFFLFSCLDNVDYVGSKYVNIELLTEAKMSYQETVDRKMKMIDEIGDDAFATKEEIFGKERGE